MNKRKFVNMVTKAINAFEKQGVPSRNSTDGGCCYRKDKHAKSEVKCIVGHMFADIFYTPSMECFGASSMAIKSSIYFTVYTKKEIERQTHEFDEQQEALILLFQRIHDGIDTFAAESFSKAITLMRDELDKYTKGRFKYKLDELGYIISIN